MSHATIKSAKEVSVGMYAPLSPTDTTCVEMYPCIYLWFSYPTSTILMKTEREHQSMAIIAESKHSRKRYHRKSLENDILEDILQKNGP